MLFPRCLTAVMSEDDGVKGDLNVIINISTDDGSSLK